ncbi:MAG: ATP-binding cassette domain-containing protein, partial [Firmicutes bacterium]|nr:ATP-binding cassette domain-containing protein [Bacillota bacterium]
MSYTNNALEIRNLSKHYEDFQLDHINLTVPAGAIVGLIGENGAGKSTTIKAVMNLIHKDSGDITIYGQHLKDDPQKLKEEISVVFDDIHFNKNFNAKEIAAICRGIYKNWDDSCWNELMERFSLPVSKKVKDFSKGMRV